MNKEKFIEWVIRQHLFYTQKWSNFYIEGNKEMADYEQGKISILTDILDLTKRGDFDDNHSN